MIRLALLRHGHTAWNRTGRIQGRTDIPLDPEATAELSRYVLPCRWQGARLVASPLRRARHTADLLAGHPPETAPALTEMDWGAWEGREGAVLRADPSSGFRDIETWGWDYRPPGGETPAEVRARLSPWIASLDADTLAVCHIGIMRVLLARATGWNFDGPCPFAIKRKRLYVIHIEGESWTLDPVPVRLVERRP
jgi:probable phosphoglycerate mutase